MKNKLFFLLTIATIISGCVLPFSPVANFLIAFFAVNVFTDVFYMMPQRGILRMGVPGAELPVMTPSRALLAWLKKNKYPTKKVTQGYLKLFALLGTSKTIEFDVIDDAGSGVVGELRLPRSDAFWSDEFGFFIGKIASGASVGTFEEETFPNPYVFTNATELAALKTLYNGNLKIEIEDRLYFQQLDLKRFEYADIAQKGTELSGGATGILQKSAFNPATGFYQATPDLRFSGSDTPTVEITLPESVAMDGTAGTTNYAVLYYRGFYIPGGAELGKNS